MSFTLHPLLLSLSVPRVRLPTMNHGSVDALSVLPAPRDCWKMLSPAGPPAQARQACGLCVKRSPEAMALSANVPSLFLNDPDHHPTAPEHS